MLGFGEIGSFALGAVLVAEEIVIYEPVSKPT